MGHPTQAGRLTASASRRIVNLPPGRRREQGRIAMADDEDVPETEPDAGVVEDEYVFVEPDQPIWQNIGQDH